MTIPELQAIAKELRVDVIRMLVEAGSGHPGGSLSCTDIVTALYFHQMRHRPDQPDWPDPGPFRALQGTLRARGVRRPGQGRLFPAGGGC